MTTTFVLMMWQQSVAVQRPLVQGIEVGDEVWYVYKLFNELLSLAVSHILPFSNRNSVEGLIMDQYCINLGHLLDNPSVITLENPTAHSVHWYVSSCAWFGCFGYEDATSIFI